MRRLDQRKPRPSGRGGSHGLELALYDYRRVSRVGCLVADIPVDTALQQRIIAASGRFWGEYVLNGRIPEESRPPVLRADDGVPPDIEARARRAVVNKIAGDRLLKDYEDDQTVLHDWVRLVGRLGDGVLPLGSFAEGAPGFLQTKATEEFDVERAVRRLRELGMSETEIEELRGPDKYDTKKISLAYDGALRLLASLRTAASGGSVPNELLESVDKALSQAPVRERGGFDKEKVISALVSFGEVPYIFITEKLSSRLPQGRSQDLDERRAIVGVHVERLVSELASCPQAAAELPAGPTPHR